jgi:hypothetical protein
MDAKEFLNLELTAVRQQIEDNNKECEQLEKEDAKTYESACLYSSHLWIKEKVIVQLLKKLD